MADTTLIQFRVDKDLKQEVSDICEALGTDFPTVFRICMKQMKMSLDEINEEIGAARAERNWNWRTDNQIKEHLV